MKNANNNVVNGSLGGDLVSEDGMADHNLEAYTVVLSAAAHVLSTLFGGGSSVAVVVAITTRPNINKYSYMLVLSLFFACCGLNFVWSPLELTDLVVFHYAQRHPSPAFAPAKTAVYLFLIIVISVVIVLLAVEGLVRMKNSYNRLLRKLWPLLASISAVLLSLLLTVIFVAKCAEPGGSAEGSYILTTQGVSSVILALILFAFIIVAITLAILAVITVKENVYWEDGHPHLRQKKVKLAIPEFLISQSNNAAVGNDGGYDNSMQEDAPSPSIPKLLMVGDADTNSAKGGADDISPIADLPSPMAKPKANRLGINMAQVLGRRRHTICQISDSTNSTTTPMDPISRAKQYNYVRKFSVDISALQAQLQNPKLFKEAPFQSDIDLTKKQSSENSKPIAPLPLLPLKPLPLKFDEKEEKPGEEEGKKQETLAVEGLKVPPPPVIMVSNDDTQSQHGDGGDSPSQARASRESSPEAGATKSPTSEAATNNSGQALFGTPSKKPTTLTFKEPSTDEQMLEPELKSPVSDPSDTESEGQKLTRLTLLMCLTFTLNMLPLVVIEALRPTLSAHAYVNISTCTLSVSVIQTIVYPHLLACCDDVVHRAVQKLKKRVRALCVLRSDLDQHSQVEDSSSTSQV